MISSAAGSSSPAGFASSLVGSAPAARSPLGRGVISSDYLGPSALAPRCIHEAAEEAAHPG